MNIQEFDIMNTLRVEPFVSQRQLAQSCHYSLGTVNRSLKKLVQEGYLDEYFRLTPEARQAAEEEAPQRAVILAAGYGMRMVPINMEMPKGLLEVQGEPLIERLIRQLKEAGIEEIHIVVGFMKEEYEYLMDQYGVDLIVNMDYAHKNNLHSLSLARDYLENAYILPCDIWLKNNPFRPGELYSWYMVTDEEKPGGGVRVSRKRELIPISSSKTGNTMIGISYLTRKDAEIVKERLEKMDGNRRYDTSFWEDALLEKNRLLIPARVIAAAEAVEINTYEQLRELDQNSSQLQSKALLVIAEVLDTDLFEIKDIRVLKKGMTNRSFLFSARGKKYIMRIPGEGTDRLINRKHEVAVYKTIAGKGICDHILYINPDNGYKITEFIEDARVCDPESEMDLQVCMSHLRAFHEQKLQVDHDFDIFSQIEFYESLWEGRSSVYRDYKQTKKNVLSLKEYLDGQPKERVLTHIDAVPDNFLFTGKTDENGPEIRLIDWEYAGMQDPHVDIAMFSIYALYNREQVDHLIDLYFPEGCSEEVRTKIYAYIAACGLLWSNWCEYKRHLGVEFGEYSLCQYRYAKDYFRLVRERIEKQKQTGTDLAASSLN